VSRPIGRDRAKMATRKGKGKECSSSQNRSSFAMGGIMSALKKLGTSFTRAQMWKQYNKLRTREHRRYGRRRIGDSSGGSKTY
jgi:hypothetical protein